MNIYRKIYDDFKQAVDRLGLIWESDEEGDALYESLQQDAKIYAFVRCTEILSVFLMARYEEHYGSQDLPPITDIITALEDKNLLDSNHAQNARLVFDAAEMFVFDRSMVPEGELQILYDIGELNIGTYHVWLHTIGQTMAAC